MTCPACTEAKRVPRTEARVSGCASCQGRLLVLLGFRREELEGMHNADVLAAFEVWMPIVRREKARA